MQFVLPCSSGCFNPRACMRRDEMPAPLLTQSPPFQSTRLHEARPPPPSMLPALPPFQSTRLHEARRPSPARAASARRFNPRACMRRDLPEDGRRFVTMVSIHAPA